MAELRLDDTAGSVDTNIRLLAQRVTSTEIDLHRLGDTVRMNTRDLQTLEAQVKAVDNQLDYRLNAIESGAKELSARVWVVILGLAGTFGALVIDILMKRR